MRLRNTRRFFGLVLFFGCVCAPASPPTEHGYIRAQTEVPTETPHG